MIVFFIVIPTSMLLRPLGYRLALSLWINNSSGEKWYHCRLPSSFRHKLDQCSGSVWTGVSVLRRHCTRLCGLTQSPFSPSGPITCQCDTLQKRVKRLTDSSYCYSPTWFSVSCSFVAVCCILCAISFFSHSQQYCTLFQCMWPQWQDLWLDHQPQWVNCSVIKRWDDMCWNISRARRYLPSPTFLSLLPGAFLHIHWWYNLLGVYPRESGG